MSCLRHYQIKPDYTILRPDLLDSKWNEKPKPRPYKDIQNAGKISVFVSCGYCESCQKKSQYAWGWRLCSDLQYYVNERGYKVGFITLTYNEKMCPRFDKVKYPELEGMRCFDKDHTDKLLLYLRKTLYRDYGLKEFLYFLASERGKRATRRPHYHLIIAWNPSSGLSAEEMHKRIKHYWSDVLVVKTMAMGEVERPALGFVTPRYPQGGERKRDGKKILPFEVNCNSQFMKCAFYTCKYITKDFYFMREIRNKVKSSLLKDPNFKRFLPHHRQSKSLGFHGIASLSDAEKLELLLRGKCLLGDDKLTMPPLYIQNKILFSPTYIVGPSSKEYPDGKRLVYRECTQFYKDYFNIIMDAKLKYYDMLFERMMDVQFWAKEGIPLEKCQNVSACVRQKHLLNDLGCTISEAYLFYYGMKYHYCFVDKKLTFINRFRHPAFVYSSLPLIRWEHWCNIQEFFFWIFDYMKFSEQNNIRDEAVDESREYFSQIESTEDDLCPSLSPSIAALI